MTLILLLTLLFSQGQERERHAGTEGHMTDRLDRTDNEKRTDRGKDWKRHILRGETVTLTGRKRAKD